MKFWSNMKTVSSRRQIIATLLAIAALTGLTSSCHESPKAASLKGQTERRTSSCPWAGSADLATLETAVLVEGDRDRDLYTQASLDTANLSPEDVATDLACLKMIFEKVYSGTLIFDRAGISLIGRVDALVAEVQSTGRQWSRRELLQALGHLHEGAFDGHAFYRFYNMAALYAGDTKYRGTQQSPRYPTFIRSSSRFERDGALFRSLDGALRVRSCAGLSPVRLAGKVNEHYGFVGFTTEATLPTTVPCVGEAGEEIPLTLVTANGATAPSADERSAGATLTQLSADVRYLRVGSFPNPMTAAQDAIAQTLSREDFRLIIDARGVGGGADPFTTAMESALFAADETYRFGSQEKVYSLLMLTSITQVYMNQARIIEVDPRIPGADRPARLAAARAQVDSWKTVARQYATRFGLGTVQDRVAHSFDLDTSFGERSERFDRPIVMIIDRGCGSQCEFLVSLLRHHPRASVIGAPTAGRLNFASNGSLYLPRSGVEFWPSTAATTHDPAAIEGEGLTPDLYVLDEDPIPLAHELIRSMP